MRLPRWCIGVLLAGALGGCGGGDELKVSAAASLKIALSELAEGRDGATVRLSFAGSDELAAQLRAGARPGLFAAADASLAQELFDEGLVERPVPFATNRLVIAVAAEDPRVRSVEDLGRPGTAVALGAPSVPVGRYAGELLDALPPGLARRIRANVRTEEPDVSGVVGKVALGAVDAGIVYASDVAAAQGRLRAVAVADERQPRIVLSAAVVRGSGVEDAARDFLADLTGADGRAALRAAGLAPPP